MADYQKRAKAGELTAGIFGWSGDNGDPDNFLSPLLASANAGNQTLLVSKMQNLMPY